ncbi:hypothetical protein FRC02_005458 [Tulasnella sp. 418]|nr:hypothetical protein FRC02_005458 [Tulasnella sp. 418]
MTSHQPSEDTILKALDLLIQDVKCGSLSNSNPSDHTGEVEDIDSKIHALKTVSTAFQRVIEAQLVRHHRHRNAIASTLLRCPDEIISEIFLYLVDSAPIKHRYQYLYNLQLVCSQFYHVSEMTTTLWTCIDSDLLECEGITNASHLIDMLLRKSKNAPLDIRIQFRADCPGGTLWLLDRVVPYVHRWRSFFPSCVIKPRASRSWLQEVQESLQRLCMMKAPQLRKFDLSLMKAQSLPELSTLFDDFAPRLQWLDIIGIPISWDSPILSGLTRLGLSAWNGTSTPTVDQYQRVLLSCPRLEILKIKGRRIDYTRDDLTAVFHHSIPLPNLRQLTLDDLHPSTTRSLLSSIKAYPEVLIATLGGAATDSQCMAIVESVFLNPHVRHYLQAVLISECKLCLQFTGTSASVLLEVIGFERYKLFNCTFVGVRTPIPLYRVLLPPSSRAMIRCLYFHVPVGGNWLTDDFGPREFFKELVELRELTVVDPESDLRRTLAPLSKPVSEANSGGRWLCPRLQELRIEFGNFSIDDLLQFLESRYNNNDPPTSLSRLSVFWNPHYHEMIDIPTDVACKVVQLVGMDGFIWDGHRFQAGEGKWVRME